MHLFQESPIERHPAIFFDRDGVIIEEVDYIANPRDVKLIKGASSAIKSAREMGFRTVIITNQSGIGRGFFGWADYLSVENYFVETLRKQGVQVDGILACGAAPGTDADEWRKPSDGMLLAAALSLNLDLHRSIVVGDKASDLEAGKRAGLRLGVHVATGHGTAERKLVHGLESNNFTVRCLPSIQALISILAAEA